MDKLSNNLFFYANKELSQDAFICWLCSFGLEGANRSDMELVKCANNLVAEFVRRGIHADDIKTDEVRLKKIEKQVNNIDVLLMIEYLGETYRVIIEDKIHASEHDNQLQRYKKSLFKENEKLIGIYFKTGFQSDRTMVENEGYVFFDRKDILGILRECRSENAIFRDYCEYWEEFERLANSYKLRPIDEWTDWQVVNGFYDEMQSELKKRGVNAGYGYVSNKSGGFWGLWFGTDNNLIEGKDFVAEIYLQVEIKWNNDAGRHDVKICLKMEKKSDHSQDDQTRKLRDFIVDKMGSYGFDRPGRLGYGQYMTVGNYRMSVNTAAELDKAIFDCLADYKRLVNDIKGQW
ncbi:MAG: hypothetical protein E7294_15860 [Lachnospiraceae bacterium]|nr:hypothetical protein [Lachnospiraceae bacterium]